MASRKKFGRPAPFDVENNGPTGAVRAIQMSREGGALEGAYAAVASRDDLRLAPYETHRRSVVSSSIKAWCSLILFWLSVAVILSTFVN